jgi:DNA-binding NarL/FixJ family response regulator/class 3 adenylate cyclase
MMDIYYFQRRCVLSSEHVERRLTAILAADVAGYSRLMGADEEGTLAQLKAFRKTLVDLTIGKHRGRIVKTTGDGMLFEFASALDAARCAVEVQRGIAGENSKVPLAKRIEFRIGIHLGDIIIDDNDSFGDGVNVAARLEWIAEPGGVCISDDAHRQIRGKIDIAFEDIGSQSLKNIAEPMRAWRVRITDEAASAIQSGSSPIGQALVLPDKPSKRRGMKILLVDDHVLIRDALRGVLKELAGDATVLEASDCRQAMRLIEAHPDLHLILLDLNLPDRDGFEVLADLRKRYATISLVVLSALHDRQNVIKALDLGALGFIPKSAPRDVMVNALRLIFAGGMYIPPEALGRLPTKERYTGAGHGVSPAELGFTERQMEVLALMMQGKSNKAISRILDVAEPTVKHHVTAILKALKVANRTEAVIAVGSLGWEFPQIAER